MVACLAAGPAKRRECKRKEYALSNKSHAQGTLQPTGLVGGLPTCGTRGCAPQLEVQGAGEREVAAVGHGRHHQTRLSAQVLVCVQEPRVDLREKSKPPR